ncbi:MAG: DTW domain-containing protein, partial [Roseateles sp.]
MPRPTCARCERPAATCLCATLPAPPLPHRTELLILQHPAEAGHAKNTTALLTLGLARARRLRGELFDAALAGPGTALVYPGASPAPLPAPGGRRIRRDGRGGPRRRRLAAHPGLARHPRRA